MIVIQYLYKTMYYSLSSNILNLNYFLTKLYDFLLNFMRDWLIYLFIFVVSILYFFNLGMSVSYENTKAEIKDEYFTVMYNVFNSNKELKKEVEKLKKLIYSFDTNSDINLCS